MAMRRGTVAIGHAARLLLGPLALLALAGCGTAAVAPAATLAPAATARSPLPPASATPLPTAAPTPTALPTSTPLPDPPTAAPTATSAPLSAARRAQIFSEVWTLVKTDYLYPDFDGLDWDAIRVEYAARVAAVENDEAFYRLMEELIGRLNDGHSRFVPPAAVADEDAFSSGHELHAGIGVVTIPSRDGAFIQLVLPGSPAERAGLRPRDRILAVNDRAYSSDDGDLQGPPGTTVRLSVVRPGERPRDVVLVRQELQGRIAPYARRFPGEIGYIWVSTLWVSDMDEQVNGALTELLAAGKLNGLILDLRGNRGGWGNVMNGILGHFVRGQVGVFFKRTSTRPLVISAPAGPDLRAMRGRLAVLIDQDTASYAELIAAILQREARAIVVGMPSAGNTETIYAHALSDGSRLWLAQEGFRMQDGTSLENHGVQPDSLVDVDWKRYSEDDDPVLLEALRLLGAGPK